MAAIPNSKATRSFNRLPRVAAVMADRIHRVNTAASFRIQERAVDSMGGGKSGRTYIVHNRRHVASAPGEAPGIVYGTLANSVFTDNKSPFVSFVYSTDEKAPYLEFGTHKGGYFGPGSSGGGGMAPRPWLTPAATAEEAPYVAALKSVLASAVKA